MTEQYTGNSRGVWTVIGLGLALLVSVGLWVFVFYAVIHFAVKFW
jgi:hypothetical protein